MKNISLKHSYLLIVLLINTSCLGKTLELRKVKDFQNAYELREEFLRYMVELFNTEVFIETGTFAGYTVTNAAKVFKEVHSVEIDETLQKKNQARFSDNAHVYLYTGDSVKLLPTMIKTVGNKKALYFIDAHWAEAGNTLRYPIIEELKIIAQQQDQNPVILIDDLRDFDIYGQGIISVTQVFKAIKELFPNYRCYIYGDSVIAFSKSEPIKASSFIKAITFHRLNFKKKFDSEDILKSEEIIAQANDTELAALEDIAKTLPNTDFHSYWAGLIQYKQKNYSKALKWFEQAQKYGFKNTMVKNYIQKSRQ